MGRTTDSSRGRRVWVSTLRALLCLACLQLSLRTLSAAAPVSASIHIVSTTFDSGPGSLRQAIGIATANDLIVFDPGLTGATIGLTSGQLVIDKDLVVDGSDAPGVSVSGGGLSRVFLVAPDAVVELRALAIVGGKTRDGVLGENAEGGGGIDNRGTLRLVACVVRDNRTGDGGSGAPDTPAKLWGPGGNGGGGGGISNSGNLTLEASSVFGNQTGRGGDTCLDCEPELETPRGGDGGDGGGILSSGALTVTNSTVRGNATGERGSGLPEGNSGEGGGIYATGDLLLSATEVVSNTTADGGGRAARGGGIFVHGAAVILDSSIARNATGTGFEGGDGAGIYATGTLDITGSSIEFNRAGAGGAGGSSLPYYYGGPGGPGGEGGGIYFEDGVLNIVDTSIAYNLAGDGGPGGDGSRFGGEGGAGGSGGGVWAAAAGVVIADSQLSHNRTGAGGAPGCGYLACGRGGDGGSGGAVLLNPGVSAVISGSTMDQNRAGDAGPICSIGQQPCGIAGSGGGLDNGGTLHLHNSTVSGNQAGSGPGPLGQGGGFYNRGTARVGNATIAGNRVPASASGGGLWTSGAALLQDTLLASNMAGQTAADCGGAVLLVDHNLVERSAGCILIGDPQNNVLDRPALIGPLALNAPGTTETHALLPGSPAIDVGACSNGASTSDQRGVPRPQGAGCDIGAYERELTGSAWRPVYLPAIVMD